MKANRSQAEIDFEAETLQIEIVELRKNMHDNCDMNDCHACEAGHEQTDIKNISIELDHAIKHKITMLKFRDN